MFRILPGRGIYEMCRFLAGLAVLTLACAAIPAAQSQQTAEKTFTIPLEIKEHQRYCKAKVTLEYSQYNTEAGIKGLIENPDCGASSGGYTLAIRVRDDDGNFANFEHEETWGRDDDQPIAFDRRYPIGENVDLIRVRARGITCICAAMAPEGEQE